MFPDWPDCELFNHCNQRLNKILLFQYYLPLSRTFIILLNELLNPHLGFFTSAWKTLKMQERDWTTERTLRLSCNVRNKQEWSGTLFHSVWVWTPLPESVESLNSFLIHDRSLLNLKVLKGKTLLSIHSQSLLNLNRYYLSYWTRERLFILDLRL